jgi:hypothetical protein
VMAAAFLFGSGLILPASSGAKRKMSRRASAPAGASVDPLLGGQSEAV